MIAVQDSHVLFRQEIPSQIQQRQILPKRINATSIR